MKLSEELQWRGFVHQTTLKNITDLDNKVFTFYWGVDPSAPSMTIGNLATAMMVRHFINYGHKAVLLVGGATGMIGDPDGKAEERTLKSIDDITRYKDAISEQYRRIFDGQDFKLVDNYDWFKAMGYLQFLRDVGKHVPMRQMLGRDFVEGRLQEGGAGISYAEFSYVLIQGYDFLHLFKELGVTLQVCGSDQWGNSIAGVELIRRITGQEAHVWSTPLILNKATGKKFGKSEEGAVWLDAKLTSPYKFYQFWLNADDDGVEDYLKVYTLLSKEEVQASMHDFQANPAQRAAQKKLAHDVTKIVHGPAQADKQARIAEAIANQNLTSLNDTEINTLKEEIPTAQADAASNNLIAVLVTTGLASSKSEARQLIGQGAIYIDGKSVHEAEIKASPSQKYAFVRKGKTLHNSALLEF